MADPTSNGKVWNVNPKVFERFDDLRNQLLADRKARKQASHELGEAEE